MVPTYDEADNLAELIAMLRKAVPGIRVLVVDDDSPDGTAEVARALAVEHGDVDVVVRHERRGLGSAYRDGFRRAIDGGADVCVQIDADLSHDPAALPSLLAELEKGADLVIGSRYVPGGSVPHWPLHRRALSRFGNRYTSFALRTGVNDATAGYRAYRAEMLRKVRYDTTRAVGYGFQIELAYRVSRVGGRIVEVPITFTDRTRGQSKMSPKVAAEELLLVTWWGLLDRLPFSRDRDLHAGGSGVGTPPVPRPEQGSG